MMKKIGLIFACLLFTLVPLAAEQGIVIQVSHNTTSFAKLDAGGQLYARSALQSFVNNLTLMREITVRTEENDRTLNELQKTSQVDASRGLGSEASAYATDLVSRADLQTAVSLVKYAKGWKLEYSISEIETQKIIAGGQSDSYFEIDSIDEEADVLSYKALCDLHAKGFISPVPYSIQRQLTHAKDTEENYSAYILELTRQIAEDKAELERLQKLNATEADRIEAERKQQALRLRIQAQEKARLAAEESLRRQREDEERRLKQELEIRQLNDEKKSELARKFRDTIQKNKEQQLKLSREYLKGLSLSKRIEFIEEDRQILRDLESQLDVTVKARLRDIENREKAEIDKINATPWRNGETDAEGNPTSKAKTNRQKKIQSVRDSYAKQKSSVEAELRKSFSDSINAYQKQIDESVAELEKTEFVYRSFLSDCTELTVNVSPYDGVKYGWEVFPVFAMRGMYRVKNIPDISSRNYFVSYKEVTGRDARSDEENRYQEYLDQVDLADMCFRTDIPYIYGELTLKVKYDPYDGLYAIDFRNFNLRKMEDNSILHSFSSGDYNNIKKAEAAEKHREERKEEHVRQVAAVTSAWNKMQRGRSGVFLSGAGGDAAHGESMDFLFQALFGGSHLYGGIYIGVDTLAVSDRFFSRNDFTNVNVGVNFGTCVTLGPFRPYLETGVGVGSAYDSNKSKSDPVYDGLLEVKGRAGVDLKLGNGFTLGAFYESTYREKFGARQCAGFLAGFSL